MQAPVPSPLPIGETAFKARALLLGERLDLRGFKVDEVLGTNPLAVAVPGGGVAVLYRYGVVVLFGVHSAEEVAFLTALRPFVSHPYEEPEIDEIEIRIGDAAREGLAGGVVLLAEADVPRLQVLADVLSKSVLLSLYERKVASQFDRIEPFAAQLARDGRIPRRTKELLTMIGSMTLVEQRMVGRAEIADKPEVLWEHPSLEGLFAKVEDEFEIETRHAALERKLNLIAQTVRTVLQLESNKHTLHVEWYIVELILIAIVLMHSELLIF